MVNNKNRDCYWRYCWAERTRMCASTDAWLRFISWAVSFAANDSNNERERLKSWRIISLGHRHRHLQEHRSSWAPDFWSVVCAYGRSLSGATSFSFVVGRSRSLQTKLHQYQSGDQSRAYCNDVRIVMLVKFFRLHINAQLHFFWRGSRDLRFGAIPHSPCSILGYCWSYFVQSSNLNWLNRGGARRGRIV